MPLPTNNSVLNLPLLPSHILQIGWWLSGNRPFRIAWKSVAWFSSAQFQAQPARKSVCSRSPASRVVCYCPCRRMTELSPAHSINRVWTWYCLYRWSWYWLFHLVLPLSIPMDRALPPLSSRCRKSYLSLWPDIAPCSVPSLKVRKVAVLCLLQSQCLGRIAKRTIRDARVRGVSHPILPYRSAPANPYRPRQWCLPYRMLRVHQVTVGIMYSFISICLLVSAYSMVSVLQVWKACPLPLSSPAPDWISWGSTAAEMGKFRQPKFLLPILQLIHVSQSFGFSIFAEPKQTLVPVTLKNGAAKSSVLSVSSVSL